MLQNLLQLTGSVKSQNQSRGHVLILAIYHHPHHPLDDLPSFSSVTGLAPSLFLVLPPQLELITQTWMSLQMNAYLDVRIGLDKGAFEV